MVTELNIYIALALAVFLLVFAVRLGISLYKAQSV
ncbi:MAG: photosystem I reaction center subunit XII [Flavobacterium sp.]|jgi:photosystem I reaction center subunit XII|nr:photosystem I reaction center subunit XII [Flavobacterium sp.]